MNFKCLCVAQELNWHDRTSTRNTAFHNGKGFVIGVCLSRSLNCILSSGPRRQQSETVVRNAYCLLESRDEQASTALSPLQPSKLSVQASYKRGAVFPLVDALLVSVFGI